MLVEREGKQNAESQVLRATMQEHINRAIARDQWKARGTIDLLHGQEEDDRSAGGTILIVFLFF